MRPLVTAGGLARLRALQEENLPEQAEFKRRVVTRLPGGVASEALVPDPDRVPCRFVRGQRSGIGYGVDVIQADQIREASDCLVILPAGTDVTGVQQIVVHGVFDGAPWVHVCEVVSVDAPRTNEVRRAVRCRMTEPSLDAPAAGEG